MTILDLQKKRDELDQAMQNLAVQMERIRGAMMLCDQLIQESQGNGADIQTEGEHDDAS